MREISNREFAGIERAALRDLARRIKGAGVSYSRVAKGTHLSYKTVSRAARGQAVRSDAMIRIDFYLRELKRDTLTNGAIL